jgi:trimeric autotransporter adhesin
MSLAKTLLTAFVALAATASAQIRSANAEAVIPNSRINVSVAGFVPFRETGLAIATGQTARVDVNLKVGTAGATVEVAAQAAQIQATQIQATQNQADSSAVTNATDAQVINDVPNVTQNPLFYAMLQNGVQPRNETSTSTLGDLYTLGDL